MVTLVVVDVTGTYQSKSSGGCGDLRYLSQF